MAVSVATFSMAPVLASGPVISQEAPMQGSARCAVAGWIAIVATPRTSHAAKLERFCAMPLAPLYYERNYVQLMCHDRRLSASREPEGGLCAANDPGGSGPW